MADFENCFKLMTRISAEEALLDMSISQYPHSDKDYRKKLHKEMHTLASVPQDSGDAEMVPMESFASLLARGGQVG